jgi:hypothetical protein
MLNIRMIILSVGLVLILMLTAQWVTARTEVVLDPSNDPAAVMENHQSTNQNKEPIPSFRPPRDVCFDVPLGGAVTCPIESPTLVSSYRSPLDECYDVSLREATNCRNESQPPVPLYRSPLDGCYDVPLREVASCRNADQASAP